MSLIDKDKLGLTDFEIVSCKDYKEVLQKLLNKIDSAEVIDAVPREEHEAIVYAREQIAYNRGLMDGRKEQLMTSGYVTTVSDTTTEPVSVYTYANSPQR